MVAFKERFGLSRKWTIPLLEHLDDVGVTRRIGEERELRGAVNPSNGVKLNSSR
ncbi:MAG: SelB C-terminal domain-containing protein [Thermoanaerobaculia bacterium]